MEVVKRYTAQFEEVLEKAGRYSRPVLPAVARFLMVATFLEDSLRICSQWGDQRYYLSKYRGFPPFGADLFLSANVTTMTVCSVLSIVKRYPSFAVGGLFAAVTAQSIGYGLIFDPSFFLRTLSVCGGLLMLLADAYSREVARATYLQLAGRVLLVLLFVAFASSGAGAGAGEGSSSISGGGGSSNLLLQLLSPGAAVRAAVGLVSVVGCVMVVVGFKARYSAWVLITFLCVSNVVLNNWWTLHQSTTFFQNLSVMGGFLLLANLGPGGISVDEKKKNF
ncbi:SURF4 family-domain-containing protein [Zopfochytrium polystomum]|nr:SURF4 family-domain-containing protein [Zopfochytrium polystomum]